jgi:hypothetical protein
MSNLEDAVVTSLGALGIGAVMLAAGGSVVYAINLVKYYL